MTKKTISIGGATYDLFVQTDQQEIESVDHQKLLALPLGEKVPVHDIVESAGGGASNTSIGLARLGCNAHFCGVLSSDQWGSHLKKTFETEGVDLSAATIVQGEVSSFSIILSAENGERVILYEAGVNAHLQDATFNKETVGSTDWVYFNHIQERTCVIQDDIIDLLTGENAPCLTWNPGGCQIEYGLNEKHTRQLLPNTDLLLLNKEEALRFTEQSSIEQALQALQHAGAKMICITDGSRGTIGTDGDHIYHCPVLTPEKIVDTTGAGDAFGTGVTWGLIQGFDLPQAMRAGTINASSVVGAMGAQAGLLTDTQMHERLQTTELEVQVSPQS